MNALTPDAATNLSQFDNFCDPHHCIQERAQPRNRSRCACRTSTVNGSSLYSIYQGHPGAALSGNREREALTQESIVQSALTTTDVCTLSICAVGPAFPGRLDSPVSISQVRGRGLGFHQAAGWYYMDGMILWVLWRRAIC